MDDRRRNIKEFQESLKIGRDGAWVRKDEDVDVLGQILGARGTEVGAGWCNNWCVEEVKRGGREERRRWEKGEQ